MISRGVRGDAGHRLEWTSLSPFAVRREVPSVFPEGFRGCRRAPPRLGTGSTAGGTPGLAFSSFRSLATFVGAPPGHTQAGSVGVRAGPECRCGADVGSGGLVVWGRAWRRPRAVVCGLGCGVSPDPGEGGGERARRKLSPSSSRLPPSSGPLLRRAALPRLPPV